MNRLEKTMKRCPTCKRTFATDADWAAFSADPTVDSCNGDDCPWGADRCWNEGACGISPEDAAPYVAAGKALRGRRQWSAVPHSAAHAA